MVQADGLLAPACTTFDDIHPAWPYVLMVVSYIPCDERVMMQGLYHQSYQYH